MSNDSHPPTAAEQESRPRQDALFPADEQPWPDARHRDDLIFDHGIHWCDRGRYHPDAFAGYPHPDHYRTECRSQHGCFVPGRLDYAGPTAYIEIYTAKPFCYGQRADQPSGDLRETRLILAAVPLDDSKCPVRFSLPIAEARNLARHLHHLADVVDGYAPPWAPLAG